MLNTPSIIIYTSTFDYFVLKITIMDQINNILHDVYYTPGGVAALAGISAVHKEAQKRLGHKIPQKVVRDWLRKQYVYLRHKRLRKPKGQKLPTVPIIRTNTHIGLDCDLAQFKNSRYKYGLMCIDQMSAHGYVAPMTNKSAKTTARAMQQLIDTQAQGKWPASIRTDKGSEFYSAFDQLLKKNKVKHHFTDANQKSSFAESFIGKFRGKLEKMKTVTGKQDWTIHWHNVLNTLNSTPQSRTGIAPKDVNESNVGIIFGKKMTALEKQMSRYQYEQFSVGSPVRISLSKSSTFEKSSRPGFSAEIFFVRAVQDTEPLKTYLLSDSVGNEVSTPFYPYELLHAEPDYDLHKRINKIHSRRATRNGAQEFLVSFQEYPATIREWISAKQLDKLRGFFQ